jgi:spore maturation protein CgeB
MGVRGDRPMKLVVFGLTISSSWGNGHATLWRGLVRALAARGWSVTFFERDVGWYREHRDLTDLEGGALALYAAWEEALPRARAALAEADVAMVTSYCPDGAAAAALVREAGRPLKVFYDMDTPVTMARLARGEPVEYIGESGLAGFDLALSFTGGAALTALSERLGAPLALPLYGHVDASVHRPAPDAGARFDLSYLGTYAADRQAALEELLVLPARMRPDRSFVIAGAQYPDTFPWCDNIFFKRHLEPARHAAFYASSRLTLNVTRDAMARMGHCPSGRLFAADACGAAILTDAWEGLEDVFTPGEEILVARDGADALAAIERSDVELARIAEAGREKVLAGHTSARRAADLEAAFETALDVRAARAGARQAGE